MFLTISLNVGGTEKHILNLASGLNREKFNSVICCLSDIGLMGERINKDNLKIYNNLLKNKYDIFGVWKLMNILRKENIGILYTINSPLTQFWGTFLSKATGLKACVTRVSATNPTFHRKRRKIVNTIMLPFVTRVIAQADSHKDYLINSEGIKEDKIYVVYNGIEPETFEKLYDNSEIRAKLGIGKNAPVIGIVARLAPEKGHSIFLKAARKIIGQFPQACFIVIGDGEEKNNLKDLTRDLKIESNVFFLGTREDIPQMLSIFDIAVLSSYPMVETFSNAILEYMAAGKPVVATDVGSTVDLVGKGETGLVVPYGDPEALADAVLELLKKPDLARAMGKAGRERVQKQFTLRKMIDNYEELFVMLVNDRTH